MNTKMRVALAAIVATGMPLVVNAGAIYGGVGIGNGSIKTSKFIDCVANECNNTFGDNQFAWNVFAGYSFTDAVAVELSYQDWGDFKNNAFGLTDVKLNPTMFNVMAVGTAPIAGDFSAFGKVGISFASVDGSEGGFSDTTSSQDLALGGGVQWDIGNFGVRAEALWVNLEDTDKALTFGLAGLYKFKL
jgi:opacity protein-like surface antigen